MIKGQIIRQPDKYRTLSSEKNKNKWDKITTLFFQNKIHELSLNHKTGTRGRILEILASKLFRIQQIPCKKEPVFYHVKPNEWYVDFSKKHKIKLREHDFYNPDLFLDNGTWVEVTLSENTAYKKLFRYGHQATNLLILWLDIDNGLHKNICNSINFPNAEIKSIESFSKHLNPSPEGLETTNYLRLLKELKGTIL